MAEKVVRFYTPELVDAQGKRKKVNADFWKDLRAHLAKVSGDKRVFSHNSVPYFGEAGVGTAPAVPFIRIGRVRYPADWPEVLDANNTVQSLTAPGNLLESAYLVPFGTAAKIAIMGPIRGLVSISAITAWLVAALDLPKTGHSLELVPEVDPQLAAKLANANGASTLRVRIPAGETIDWPNGPTSKVERAFEEAATASGELDVVLEFSFGRRTPGTMRTQLLQAAQRLLASGAPTQLKAGLLLDNEDGDGYRVEQHDLLNDRIARTAKFDTADGQQLSPNQILQGISGAIGAYQGTN